MLLHLHVKNLALIREAEIDFTGGLNILTGETGAGKSIVIGSITMALGGKVPREMLRPDADDALAELIFSADPPKLRELLQKLDIPVEDGQLILSRRISGNRSVCRINGTTVSTAALREISSCLIDIHGQHEHQSLLHRKKHMEILDSYAHEEMDPVKEQLAESFRRSQRLKKELEQASMDEAARLREQSLLEFELQELEEAGLQEGEDGELEQRYRKMVNSRKILEALILVQGLCAEGETSAAEQTGRGCRELSGVIRHDGTLENLFSQLQQIDGMLADFGRELTDYMEGLEFSEQDFYETQERLNLINRLKAKYGQTLEEIAAAREEKRERLEHLLHLEEYRSRLETEYEEARRELEALGSRAHGIRVKYAEQLSSLMQEQLSELNFLSVRFEIRVEASGEAGALGFDEVEFLISTNPGEELKPLGKIASGGELSRVMLAIKTVLADQDEIGTVIFDEIDTGISGRTAQRVSEKLALIGRSRQVICITHLAQLAAMADSHYCIEKKAVDGSTSTSIRRLREEEATEELARILGGTEITDAVRRSAGEMRSLALRLKAQYEKGKN